MPTVPGFINTLEDMRRIHEKKNQDYAVEDNPFSNFDNAEYIASLFNHPADRVYATLVGIKLARLGNLLSKDESPQNESIDDSFLDLLTYINIWKCKRQVMNGKPRHYTDAEIEERNTA